MSKLGALTKVLFKTNLFAGENNSNGKKKNKFLSWVLIAFLLIFVIGSLGVPIVMTLDAVLEISPLENIFISLILPLAGVTTIIFSIFSVVSVFYLSKDSDHLLHLPIAPKDIMLSKFFVSLMNEYYILFMFILPCLIGVGVGIDASAMYYVYSGLIFLLLPIIPSAIVTLIVLIVTRFTGIMKNKDLFMYISMFLVIAFALAYNFVVQGFIAVDPENIGTTFGSLEAEAIPYLKMIFPFYNSASEALMNFDNMNGIFSLITFICFNLAAILVIYFVGDKLYLKTLTTNGGSKSKKTRLEDIKCKKESVFSMLLKKEWLVIKRTPVFMLNIVVMVFIMPIIFVMSFMIGYGSGDATSILPDKSVVLGYLDNPMVYLIVLVVGVFFTSFSLAASTSISREGSNAWIMKVIPVSAFRQISVKVFFAALLDIIGVLLVMIIPIILFEIPIYYALCVLIPVILIVFILNYLNILLDLRKPRIKWSEESVAVKQNMNGVVSMFLTMAIAALFGLVAYFVYRYSIDINVASLSGIVSGVCVIILALIILWFKKNDNKLLDNVD